jgi:hypothetical protein
MFLITAMLLSPLNLSHLASFSIVWPIVSSSDDDAMIALLLNNVTNKLGMYILVMSYVNIRGVRSENGKQEVLPVLDT